MPSKYLFLAEPNRIAGTGNPKWQNLPTISQSTRECYLTITDATIVFNSTQTHDSLNIKMIIPSSNYFSSDNESPMVAFMDTTDDKIYRLQHENKISILTNDNLKSVEFILEDNNGSRIDLSDDDSIEVMIKLDYVNQDAMVNQVLLEYPKHL
jgi:hypothetical protein